jgi:hypothetical protein
MRGATHLIVVLAGFFLIGAVVNVGVAWGCATRAKNLERDAWLTLASCGHYAQEWHHDVPARWPPYATHGSQRVPGATLRVSRTSPVLFLVPGTRIMPHRDEPELAFARECGITVLEAGWPCRSLKWELWDEVLFAWGSALRDVQTEQVGDDHPDSFLYTGILVGSFRMPLMPIATGFLANTLMYGLAAACLWRVPQLCRRWIWRCVGACPVCGYPRAGLAEGAVCPECGAGENSKAGDQQSSPS